MKTRDRLERRAVKEIEGFLRAKHSEMTGAVRALMSQRRTQHTVRSADVAVWATESLNDEIEVALVDRHSQQVAQIEAALDRLGRGEYGICHDCDEFIGLPRLRALPFAQRCNPCQSRAELRARRVAHPVPVGVGAAREED